MILPNGDAALSPLLRVPLPHDLTPEEKKLFDFLLKVVLTFYACARAWVWVWEMGLGAGSGQQARILLTTQPVS